MQLSKQAINEYQQIHKEVFGETITETDANKDGLSLLKVFRIIYKPIPTNEMRKDERIYSNTK